VKRIGLVQGDPVTQGVELLDQSVALAVGVAAGEVVPAEVVVVAVVGQ
jgi:hypothetical protein